LRKLQDISEDESDASDDIFDPNGDEDEDYEPPRAVTDQVTAMRKIHVGWRKNWKTMCSNKSCLP